MRVIIFHRKGAEEMIEYPDDTTDEEVQSNFDAWLCTECDAGWYERGYAL